MYVYIVHETSLNSGGTVLCNVGRVIKCQPFLKHSNHLKWALIYF